MIDNFNAASRYLSKAYPKASWSLIGEGAYSELKWFSSTSITRPSLDAFNNGVQDELLLLQAEEYQGLRAKEYPPLADLADAMYWQSKGDNTKMDAYNAAVEAVKTKYPKGA